MLLTSAAPALADRGCVGRSQPSEPKPPENSISIHPSGTSTHLQLQSRPRRKPRTGVFDPTTRPTLATPRELAGTAGKAGPSTGTRKVGGPTRTRRTRTRRTRTASKSGPSPLFHKTLHDFLPGGVVTASVGYLFTFFAKFTI